MNEITSESASGASILEKLKFGILHSQLKELDLSFNAIGNAGIKILAAAFGSNSLLEYLDLTHCEFTAKGGFFLF